MKAQETSLQSMLEGQLQYVIPMFQRSYSWRKSQWEILWTDLTDLIELGEDASHFLGAVVTSPEHSNGGAVEQRLIIDGQQRLTTLLILLAALREAVAGTDPRLASTIETELLKNPGCPGSDAFKLLPTQADRAAFFAIIDGPELADHPMSDAYRWFTQKLRVSISPARLAMVEAVRNRLDVVSISLTHTDNPHVIFESLNSKGQPLTQADLIRNFLLMTAPAIERDRLHQEYWLPLETLLSNDLTEFFRVLLASRGRFVKKSDVFSGARSLVQGQLSQSIADQMSEFLRLGGLYYRLLSPETEPDTRLRSILTDLQGIGQNVAHPFLLGVLDEHDRGVITSEDAIAVTQAVACLLLRLAICGESAKAVNRKFLEVNRRAHERMSRTGEGYAAAAEDIISAFGLPSDDQFRTHLVESALYGNGDRMRWTRLLLERIERELSDKEATLPVRSAIDHILPQTLSGEWVRDLGPEAESVHNKWVNTLGNLTLHSRPLPTAAFPDKRTQYALLNLGLNRDVVDSESWGALEIQQRGKRLADEALKLWPSFGRQGRVQIGKSITSSEPPQGLLAEAWLQIARSKVASLLQLRGGSAELVIAEYPNFVRSCPCDGGMSLGEGQFFDIFAFATFLRRQLDAESSGLDRFSSARTSIPPAPRRSTGSRPRRQTFQTGSSLDFSRCERFTGRKPVAVVIDGQWRETSTWKDVWEQTLEAIQERDRDSFSSVASILSKYISREGPIGIRSTRMRNGWYIDIQLSAAAICKNSIRAVAAAGLDAEDWDVRTEN